MATGIKKNPARARTTRARKSPAAGRDRIARLAKAVHTAVYNAVPKTQGPMKLLSTTKGVGTPVQPSTVYVAVIYEFDV
jgi:hypothetical protein